MKKLIALSLLALASACATGTGTPRLPGVTLGPAISAPTPAPRAVARAEMRTATGREVKARPLTARR